MRKSNVLFVVTICFLGMEGMAAKCIDNRAMPEIRVESDIVPGVKDGFYRRHREFYGYLNLKVGLGLDQVKGQLALVAADYQEIINSQGAASPDWHLRHLKWVYKEVYGVEPPQVKEPLIWYRNRMLFLYHDIWRRALPEPIDRLDDRARLQARTPEFNAARIELDPAILPKFTNPDLARLLNTPLLLVSTFAAKKGWPEVTDLDNIFDTMGGKYEFRSEEGVGILIYLPEQKRQ